MFTVVVLLSVLSFLFTDQKDEVGSKQVSVRVYAGVRVGLKDGRLY